MTASYWGLPVHVGPVELGTEDTYIMRANTPKLTIVNDVHIKPDDELDPTAEDGEPEAPDVATDPVEDDPDWDHQPTED